MYCLPSLGSYAIRGLGLSVYGLRRIGSAVSETPFRIQAQGFGCWVSGGGLVL